MRGRMTSTATTCATSELAAMWVAGVGSTQQETCRHGGDVCFADIELGCE